VCHDDRHFGMVKATGLQIVTLRLPLMAWPPC
jgi:hypothetical protein